MKDSELKKRLGALLERCGTQEGFARRLGVDRATVSRWLTGKPEPNAEGYVKLGIIAPPEERFWFWRRAGLHIDELLAAAAEAAKRPLPEQVALWLGELPPEIKSLTVDERMGGAFSPGDVFLLEPSADSQDPKLFWDAVVLVEFPRLDSPDRTMGGWLAEVCPEGPYVGRLRCKGDVWGDAAHGYRHLLYYAVIGPLHYPAEGRFRQGDGGIPVGSWNHPGPPEKAQPGSEREEAERERAEAGTAFDAKRDKLPSIILASQMEPERSRLSLAEDRLNAIKSAEENAAEQEARLRARDEVKGYPWLRILGRVIAWFPAQKGQP